MGSCVGRHQVDHRVGHTREVSLAPLPANIWAVAALYMDF